MWIGSWIWFTVRQPNASPPGYQSPASGDSTPKPGSLESLNAKVCHAFMSHSLSNTPHIFFAAIVHTQLHQEVMNNHSVSQWWGHHRLHQNEVFECKGTENPLKVSCSNMICQLTTVPRDPITQMNSKHHEDKEDYDLTSWLSIAWPLAAFKNHELVESDNQSSSTTLISFPLDHLSMFIGCFSRWWFVREDNLSPNSFELCPSSLHWYPPNSGPCKRRFHTLTNPIDCYARAILTLSLPGPPTTSS